MAKDSASRADMRLSCTLRNSSSKERDGWMRATLLTADTSKLAIFLADKVGIGAPGVAPRTIALCLQRNISVTSRSRKRDARVAAGSILSEPRVGGLRRCPAGPGPRGPVFLLAHRGLKR